MEKSLPTLFFLNSKLHKRIKIAKHENIVIAFCYPEEEYNRYSYSTTLREFQKAYTLLQVATLIERPYRELQKLIKNKVVNKPSGMQYYIESRIPHRLIWSEDDVFALRNEMYDLFPKGKDGLLSGSYKLVTEASLLEKINGHRSYFITNADGEKIKVWRAV